MSRQRKRIVPNVVRGGTAIPIGDNLFYMQGRKHEQGGIDIGDNAKTGLEVEGGEVIETSPNSIRVFSSVPFLYGESPANLVRSGVNSDDVFNAQERFKDINKINDDGSMKQYKNGGLSRSKDYDSSKKPYPSVKSEDFAGGNRSYPIPTKADAIDALRLAGLHGRSDVKSKVYKKYPELRKKGLLGLEEPIDSLSIVHGLEVPTVTAYTQNYLDSLNNIPSSNPAIISTSRKRLPRIIGYANTAMSKDSLETPRIPTITNSIDSLFQQRYGKSLNELYVEGLTEDNPLNLDNNIERLSEIKGRVTTPSSIDSLTIPQVVSVPNPNVNSNVEENNYNNSRINLGLPIKELELPDYNIRDVVIRGMMNFLEDDRKFANENENTVKTSIPNNIKDLRKNNETYRQYSEAIRRNVPLPTAKATTNIGQNLNERITYAINDKIKENIINENNKNKRYNSNVVPAVLDSVGSLIDIGGNITSNILNRNMLNDLEYTDAPIPLLPTKLKTRININPQLQRLYSDLALMENAVNNNTTSSRTALARNQRLRNQVRQASNELYGNKENIETQLINRDRLNQQEVAAKNLRDYNQWRRGKAEFDNQIREALAENNVALTQGIGQSLNTLIQNLQQRNLEAKNLAYLSMSNPYAIDALNSRDFRNLYRMYGGFRCGGKKKVNRR